VQIGARHLRLAHKAALLVHRQMRLVADPVLDPELVAQRA
jgi:hypothetical protein